MLVDSAVILLGFCVGCKFCYMTRTYLFQSKQYVIINSVTPKTKDENEQKRDARTENVKCFHEVDIVESLSVCESGTTQINSFANVTDYDFGAKYWKTLNDQYWQPTKHAIQMERKRVVKTNGNE